MKTIYLVRHAKANKEIANIDDFNRTLIERGENDAKLIANHINNKKFIPELIISSSATRAFATATIFSDILKFPIEKILSNSEVYNSTTESLTKVIKNISDDYNSIMIIGHNPTMTYLVNFLTDSFLDHMPTSSFASIKVSAERWSEIKGNNNKLTYFISPKMLKTTSV